MPMLLSMGSGIAGLSRAMSLPPVTARSLSWIVAISGSGMTAGTTAHLASALDDDYAKLLKTRGLDCARQLYQSRPCIINRVEEIQTTEIDRLRFRQSLWVLASGCRARRPPGSMKNWKPARKSACGFSIAVSRRRFILTGWCARSDSRRKPASIRPKSIWPALLPASKQGAAFREYLRRPYRGKAGQNGCYGRTTQSPRRGCHRGHKLAGQRPGRDPYEARPVPDLCNRRENPWRSIFRMHSTDTHDPYHYVRLQPLTERTNAVIIGGEDHKSGEADDGERQFTSLETGRGIACRRWER